MILLTNGEAYCKDTKYTEKIERTFNVPNTNAMITIINRYGDVNITTSANGKASFDITIEVDAKSESRFKEILERITVDFTESSQGVKAETSITSESWWNSKNEHFQIHWNVNIPAGSRLDLTNKYGDISLTDLNNSADIALNYGNGRIQTIAGETNLTLGYVKNFTIDALTGTSQLYLSYSDISIASAENISLESKYSRIEIKKAGNVDIESKYDKYALGTLRSFKNTGKYDNFKIGELQSIDLSTQYTTVEVNRLVSSAQLTTSYGKVTILSIDDTFKKIDISTRYTHVLLDRPNAFQIEFDGKYTSTDFPENLNIRYRNRDNNALTLKGEYGINPSGVIRAEMKYGKLNLE